MMMEMIATLLLLHLVFFIHFLLSISFLFDLLKHFIIFNLEGQVWNVVLIELLEQHICSFLKGFNS
jgi:hypothetical protein